MRSWWHAFWADRRWRRIVRKNRARHLDLVEREEWDNDDPIVIVCFMRKVSDQMIFSIRTFTIFSTSTRHRDGNVTGWLASVGSSDFTRQESSDRAWVSEAAHL
jgi:hypothetical protein